MRGVPWERVRHRQTALSSRKQIQNLGVPGLNIPACRMGIINTSPSSALSTSSVVKGQGSFPCFRPILG